MSENLPPPVDNRSNDKELNFRNLEAKLAQERAARLEAEKAKMEIERQLQTAPKQVQEIEDEDDGEPYVNKQKLKKEQAKFGQQMKQETQTEIQRAVHTALEAERKKTWLKENPDYSQVMQHAQDFADKEPELAETILNMPDNFERHKLVYKNIKALGLHTPRAPESSIQSKIDANKKPLYYTPSGLSGPGYSSGGDFSKTGQKSAYDKMMQLKNSLRV